MTVRVGEIGAEINVGTTLDLSANTELRLKFTSPDGSIEFERTNPDVTAPGVDSPSLPNVGILPANTYMAYATDASDFAVAGDWTVCAVYADATPKLRFGQKTILSVLEGC
jgi:hypothetical protein